MKRDMHPVRRQRVAVGAVAVLVAACIGGAASTQPSPAASAYDLAKIEASVAYVQTQGTFVTADGAKEQAYSGSGFVVDPSGLIVTNNHVVTGGAFWKVSIGSDKTLLDAQLVGVSECSDLAVLKVSGATTYPALALSATDPTVGEPIYVAGHPNGDSYTLTNGIVAKPPAPADTSWASVKSQIQVTAQTYPGNSGSPVVDASGHVVGVQYAGGAPGSAIAGQSFAIAATEVKGIVDQIKASGNLDYIGLNGEVNATDTGIAVISVAPGSPADKAGIQAGDLLTNFNGTAVGTDGTKSTYCSVLRSHKSGDTLTVSVTRAGQTLSGEINGRALAMTGNPAQGTPQPGGGASSAPASMSAGIDKLEPFIPTAIWSSCQPATMEASTILQSAYCAYAGSDGAWYDLYDNSTDLKAAFDAYIQNSSIQPSNGDMATACASGNWSGTWHWNGQTADPDNGVLCAKSADGYAWMAQADPRVNVMFVVGLKDGDQAGLYQWWITHSTVVEPGS